MKTGRSLDDLRFVLLIFLLVAPPYFARPRQSNGGQKPATETVSLGIRVLAKTSGQFVRNLTKDDFLVYADGVKQEVSDLSQDDFPISVVLLLDVSGSMKKRIDLIKDVALYTLQSTRAGDEVALMTFADHAKLLQGFTKDKKLLADKIQSLNEKDMYGETHANEAVYFATTHLRNAKGRRGHRVIVAVTDNILQDGGQSHSKREATKGLSEVGAMLCALIVPPPLPETLDPFRIGGFKDYINETAGMFLYIADKNARNKLNTMMDNLHLQYTLTYKPANPKPGGRASEDKAEARARRRETRGQA